MPEVMGLNDGQQPGQEDKDLARKNIRLAIILGLIALGFYVGFILMYWN